MVNLTPNAKRVVFWQRIAMFASVIGVVYGMNALLANYTGFLYWLGMIVGSFISLRVLHPIFTFLIVMKVYNFDYDLMRQESEEMGFRFTKAEEEDEEEEESPPVQEHLALTVVARPDEPIGHYLDADIYEWIEFMNADGEKFIARFEDTINPKQLATYPIPDEHLLFPPGVLYKIDSKPQVEEDSK